MNWPKYRLDFIIFNIPFELPSMVATSIHQISNQIRFRIAGTTAKLLYRRPSTWPVVQLNYSHSIKNTIK